MYWYISQRSRRSSWFFFFKAEAGIRDLIVTGVQTCALPISGTVTCRQPKARGGTAADGEQVGAGVAGIVAIGVGRCGREAVERHAVRGTRVAAGSDPVHAQPAGAFVPDRDRSG